MYVSLQNILDFYGHHQVKFLQTFCTLILLSPIFFNIYSWGGHKYYFSMLMPNMEMLNAKLLTC
jgi:hypothetical protein